MTIPEDIPARDTHVRILQGEPMRMTQPWNILGDPLERDILGDLLGLDTLENRREDIKAVEDMTILGE